MSSGLGHRECSESLGAYLLGALPEDESAQVEGHLASCRECQAELEWLRVGADALPASVPQVEPPPGLKDRVMGIVQAEAELLRAAGREADRPATRRRAIAWWPPSVRIWVPAALAGVAAVTVAAVLLATASGTGTRTIQARVIGHPGAQASLVLRGTRAQLVVSRLPAPAAGQVEEIWVKRGSAPPQPAGTFVVNSGSVDVNRPVRPGDVVLVTVEPGRGTPQPTTQPFLVARV